MKSKMKRKKPFKVDLNYYKNVIATQNDPVILKLEMSDLIKEIKRERRSLSPKNK